MKKDYIGDSVYADMDEIDRLVLTTENGFGPSNSITLEPEVVDGLLQYIKLHKLDLRGRINEKGE